MIKSLKRAFALVLFLFMGVGLLPAESFAAEAKAPAKADSSLALEEVKKNATPVYIEFNGTDSLGSQLAFQLRERFNTSSQFQLTNDEKPKFKIILSTVPEFSSRPSVGSVFSVIWLYYERENTYSSYLVQELGTVSAEEIDGLVARLMEKSVGISAKYSYLLN